MWHSLLPSNLFSFLQSSLSPSHSSRRFLLLFETYLCPNANRFSVHCAKQLRNSPQPAMKTTRKRRLLALPHSNPSKKFGHCSNISWQIHLLFPPGAAPLSTRPHFLPPLLPLVSRQSWNTSTPYLLPPLFPLMYRTSSHQR